MVFTHRLNYFELTVGRSPTNYTFSLNVWSVFHSKPSKGFFGTFIYVEEKSGDRHSYNSSPTRHPPSLCVLKMFLTTYQSTEYINWSYYLLSRAKKNILCYSSSALSSGLVRHSTNWVTVLNQVNGCNKAAGNYVYLLSCKIESSQSSVWKRHLFPF